MFFSLTVVTLAFSQQKSIRIQQFDSFCFIPDLLARLERLRGSEKTVGEVGPTLINWVSISMATKRAEKKRKGHNPPSLSPVPVFTLLCSSLNRSQGVLSTSVSDYFI